MKVELVMSHQNVALILLSRGVLFHMDSCSWHVVVTAPIQLITVGLIIWGEAQATLTLTLVTTGRFPNLLQGIVQQDVQEMQLLGKNSLVRL